jgi:hypothetical protein
MSIRSSRALVLATVALSALASAREIRAQGCILIRQYGPEFDPFNEPYTDRGRFSLNLSYRQSSGDEHYSGTTYQAQRKALGTYVINDQHLVDLGVTYGVTERLGLSLAVPYVSSSWSVPSPTAPVPGPRAVQHGKGVGDLSLSGRYWLLDPGAQGRHNVALSLGLKAPTGNAKDTDVFVNINGLDATEKAVDYSVQPGDSGWGIIGGLQAFQRFGRVTAFGNFTYLANPKDENDTPSILVGLGLGSSPSSADRLFNTVPDQYLARVGATVGLPVKGLSASVAGRLEGQPRYDLIGDSHGFRRPGKSGYIEPGLAYARGTVSVNLNVPITVYRNREPNPYTNAAGDATFPRYVVLLGFGYRFD